MQSPDNERSAANAISEALTQPGGKSLDHIGSDFFHMFSSHFFSMFPLCLSFFLAMCASEIFLHNRLNLDLDILKNIQAWRITSTPGLHLPLLRPQLLRPRRPPLLGPREAERFFSVVGVDKL